MPAFDRHDIDPAEVSQEDIDRALEGTPAPFPETDGAQDEAPDASVRALVSAPVVPATVPQRLANARRLRDEHVNVGVGMCLATVRGPILQIPARYPTAEIAAEHSSPFHAIKSPGGPAPRGSIGFALNGRDGHVWLELGPVTVDGHPDALVSTTDFHVPGQEGVALRSRMLTWCGAQSWGWGESVNGIDVWDPKLAPKRWTWEDTMGQLERDLARAKRNNAPHRKIAGLEKWIARMKANHQ